MAAEIERSLDGPVLGVDPVADGGPEPARDALLEHFAGRVADRVVERQRAEARALPEKASLPLAEAIDAFYADLLVGKSPLTAQSYRAGLRRFAASLPQSATTVAHLTADHLVEFVRALKRRQPPLSPETIGVYTVAGHRFYAFLVREGFRPDLPLPALGERLAALRGRAVKRLARVPSDHTVEALLAAAVARPPRGDGADCLRLRDIALIECLRSSGMRVGELVGLRRRDLIGDYRAAVVLGKGLKERQVFFSPAAWRALMAYLAACDALADGPPVAAQAVFARHDRNAAGVLPLSTKGIRQIVAGLAVEAGQQEARRHGAHRSASGASASAAGSSAGGA